MNRANHSVRSPREARAGRKIGRNEPCWCGSGVKYKRCHSLADMRGEGALLAPVSEILDRVVYPLFADVPDVPLSRVKAATTVAAAAFSVSHLPEAEGDATMAKILSALDPAAAEDLMAVLGTSLLQHMRTHHQDDPRMVVGFDVRPSTSPLRRYDIDVKSAMPTSARRRVRERRVLQHG